MWKKAEITPFHKRGMAMKGFSVLITVILGVASASQAEIVGSEVTYRAGDTELRGYLAVDDTLKGRRPGVLVVPEWWGLTDYVRRRARMLAGLGYTALAVDMYGEGRITGDPEEAARLAGELRGNIPLAKRRFMAALEVLRHQPTVDPEKIAAIGYCFGGGMVLEMARSGVNLSGVVSFHGGLATENPAKPGEVKARVLVLNGEDDPMVPPEQIAMFKHEMDAAGAHYQFVNYPGAKHAFTNPEADDYAKKFHLPIAYNSEADKKCWQEMKQFFGEIFK
jgi:dienelactone hydrolase